MIHESAAAFLDKSKETLIFGSYSATNQGFLFTTKFSTISTSTNLNKDANVSSRCPTKSQVEGLFTCFMPYWHCTKKAGNICILVSTSRGSLWQ